jgi:mannose/fructose/N-acetylgalactosamine-specific phosphotransferase system component IIB
MNTLTTTKKTKQSVPFKTITEAVRAIQNTTLTETTVLLLTNSTEHQAFVRKLADMKRPVGIVVVAPKD